MAAELGSIATRTGRARQLVDLPPFGTYDFVVHTFVYSEETTSYSQKLIRNKKRKFIH